MADRLFWSIYPFPEPWGHNYSPDTQAMVVNEQITTAYFNDELAYRLIDRMKLESPEPDYVMGWLKGSPYAKNGVAH